MKPTQSNRGFTLIELLVAASMIGVVGLILFSLLNASTTLGAKNSVINATHQQARTEVLDMLEDIHSAVSVPQLVNSDGVTPWTSPTPAPGISFQKLGRVVLNGQEYDVSGPYNIKDVQDASHIVIEVNGVVGPTVGQHVIISNGIEADIAAVNGNAPGDVKLTFTSNVAAITGTSSDPNDPHVTCLITDRCSYAVSNKTLIRSYRGNSAAIAHGKVIINSNPFYIPDTLKNPACKGGAAFALSASDQAYNNRGFKSGNILLNGQVPIKWNY